MATHPNFDATPFGGSVENTEFKFSRLYWHHIYSGPSPNQLDITSADAKTGWGQTTVHNWTIYDGVGPNEKLVARAQGLHLYTGTPSVRVYWASEPRSTIPIYKAPRLKISSTSPKRQDL